MIRAGPPSLSLRNPVIAFPVAALLNSFSMTAVLLAYGLAGAVELAAEIGIVQGATLALFYAFSANARNLILADAGEEMAAGILRTRLALMVPLTLAAYLLSVGIGGATGAIALVLILRRVAEWAGEISLAQHERYGRTPCALRSIFAELGGFAICVVPPLAAGVDAALAAIPWAVVPLLAFRDSGLLGRVRPAAVDWRSLLPHFGSTAIIGTSVYVFRLSIVLLAGRPLAGELFTAFAVGGAIPTVYGQALAPTLARRYGPAGPPRKLLAIPFLMLLLGAGIVAAVAASPADPVATARSLTFWLAVGFSIAGGAIMVLAISLRTSLIHRADGADVFGPDLLANVLIATCVPFVFYALGPRSLTALYALSACLSLLFLLGAGRRWEWFARYRTATMSVLGFLLVFPVFFQLGRGLFRDTAFFFETGGALLRLPLPISVAALFAGIAILGNYAAARRTLTVLFFSALLFVFTALAVAHDDSEQEEAKLILLAQYLLPMFALVLGEMYGRSADMPVFERSALAVLALVVPAHLAATWAQGHSFLTPFIYAFSIYQHVQYLPMVVVATGLMASFALWPGTGWTRLALIALPPLLAIHAVASRSLIACASLMAGLGIFAYVQWSLGRAARSAVAVVLIALTAGAAFGFVAISGSSLKPEVHKVKGPPASLPAVVGAGLAQRADQWRFYFAGVIESPSAVLLGHASPPDRSRHPSAYNYWLDGLYNFGILALVPIAALMVITVRAIWTRRRELPGSPILLGTTVAFAYLLLVESMLKVGLRQPYPGIVGFFVWGLLLARLGAPERLARQPAERAA